LLRTLSESFDGAQDERRDFEIIGDFSFMLSIVEAFIGFFSAESGLTIP
jgi:hypothetical protein